MRNNIGSSEAFASALIDKYSLLKPNPTLNYPDPHGIYPENWYSGMGNFFLSFLLLDLSKELGRKDFSAAAVNLFKSSIREMRNGGVVIRDSDGCHLVEYAHQSIPYDKALVVLNGHLLALQSLLILTRHAETKDDATELYECALRKTKALSHSFHSAGYAYYQLNPRQVNMVSYLIFELLQFRSLYDMSGDAFYREEAEYRENILRKAYPIQFRRNDSSYEYIVSLISFPHPYLKDTFETHFSCKGRRTGRIYMIDNKGASSTKDKAFLKIRSEELLDNCSLSSRYNGNTVLLYEDIGRSGEVVTAIDPVDVPFKIISHYDAVTEGGSVKVDPARIPDGPNSQLALVELVPQAAIELSDSRLVYIKVCTSKEEITPIVRVTNALNKTIVRYWPKVTGDGCKLIILSVKGFHDYESGNFNVLSRLGFYVNTSDNISYAIDKIELGTLDNAFQKEVLVTQAGNFFQMTP
ncbi:hypothetical protein D9M70_445870 [compost metagenome]